MTRRLDAGVHATNRRLESLDPHVRGLVVSGFDGIVGPE
jgi:hypothetical protein